MSPVFSEEEDQKLFEDLWNLMEEAPVPVEEGSFAKKYHAFLASFSMSSTVARVIM